MRQRKSSRKGFAGCFVCNGNDAIWTSANAVAVAARHTDATGHKTWAEQIISTVYFCGADGVGDDRLQTGRVAR